MLSTTSCEFLPKIFKDKKSSNTASIVANDQNLNIVEKQLSDFIKFQNHDLMETETELKQLIVTLKEKEEQLIKLEEELSNSKIDLGQKDNRIVELELELNELRTKRDNQILELKSELSKLRTERDDYLFKLTHKNSDKIDDDFFKTDEITIESLRIVLQSKIAEIELCYSDIETKNNEILDKNKELFDKEKLIDDKNKEIERLEKELRKRTENLQELVNKELWEKNREIEKLECRLRILIKEENDEEKLVKDEKLTKDILEKEKTIHKLEKDIENFNQINDENLKMISTLNDQIDELHKKNKILLKNLSGIKGKQILNKSAGGNNEENERIIKNLKEENQLLNENLKTTKDQMNDFIETKDKIILELKKENDKLKQNANKLMIEFKNHLKNSNNNSDYQSLNNQLANSEKLRIESQNCNLMLVDRLEELAKFLKSLLGHKILKKCFKDDTISLIEDLCEDNLNLSRRLTMSFNNSNLRLSCANVSERLSNCFVKSSFAEKLDFSLKLNQNDLISFDTSKINLNETPNDSIDESENKQNQEGFANISPPENNISQQPDIIKTLSISANDLNMYKAQRRISQKTVAPARNSDQLLYLRKSPEKSQYLEERKSLTKEVDQQKIIDLLNIKPENVKEKCSDESEEEWSGPDRRVSLERMGLNPNNILTNNMIPTKLHRKFTLYNEGGASSSDCLDKNKKSSKENKKCIYEGTNYEDTIIDLQNKICEKDSEINQLRIKLTENDLDCYNQKVISDFQATLDKLTTYERQLSDYEKYTKELTDQLDVLKKTSNDYLKQIENLNFEKINLLEKIENLEKINRNLLDEQEQNVGLIKSLEESIKEYTDEINKLIDDKLSAENDRKLFENKIIELNEKYTKSDTELNEDLLKHKMKIQEFEIKFDEMLKNTVSKIEYTEKLNELKYVKNQLMISKNEIEAKNSRLKELEEQLELVVKVDGDTMKKLESKINDVYKRNEKLNEDKLLLQNNLEIQSKLQKDIDAKVKFMENELKEREHLIKNLESNLIEITRINNNLTVENLDLEQHRVCLEKRISQLEVENADLQNRLVQIQLQSSDSLNEISSQSKYRRQSSNKNNDSYSTSTSGVLESLFRSPQKSPRRESSSNWLKSSNDQCSLNELYARDHRNQLREQRTNERTSPDLGIESDQGGHGFSSLETNAVPNEILRPFKQPALEITMSINENLTKSLNNSSSGIDNQQNATLTALVKENEYLRKRIEQLQNDYERLSSDLIKTNQQRSRVEKAVCKELYKTSLVLKKAKVNLDSGSELEGRQK